MLEKRYLISASGNAQPPPISALMQAANLFGCNIYIAAGSSHFELRRTSERTSAGETGSRALL